MTDLLSPLGLPSPLSKLGGEEVVISGISGLGRLELDLVNGRMYWTAFGIHRANLDGTGQVELNPATNVSDLEVDAANNAFYFSVEAGLEKCDLDVANCSTLVNSATGGIEIDGTTVYFQMRSDGSIWSMDLDGNNQQQVSFGLPDTSKFLLDASNGHAYFPDESIFRADLDGSNQMSVVAGVGRHMHDVAVDGAGERFFATDFSIHTVTTASIDAPNALQSVFPGSEAASDLNRPRGLAIDTANDRLFVTTWNKSSGDGVWRIDLGGPGRTEIVGGLLRSHDVAYDPVDDKVYWNTDLGSSTSLNGRIQRSNADGTALEDILTGLPEQIRGLDIDSVNRKLYWTDMTNGQILRANLDGSAQETIVSALDNPHDIAVDTVARRIYWVEAVSDDDDPGAMIRGADLDGSSPFVVLTNLPMSTRDLTVVYHRDLFIFEDGFESGETAAWSSSVP